MSKLMFGKLISKLQLSKSTEEREGKIMCNFTFGIPILVHELQIIKLTRVLSRTAIKHGSTPCFLMSPAW